jgi:hypothetical protein
MFHNRMKPRLPLSMEVGPSCKQDHYSDANYREREEMNMASRGI